jgi:hypothetical protein
MQQFPATTIVNTITSLSDVGLCNMIIGCWELNYNTNLLAQLFEHLIVIFQGPIERALSVEYVMPSCTLKEIIRKWESNKLLNPS